METVVPPSGNPTPRPHEGAPDAEYRAQPGGVIEVLRDAFGERSIPLSWTELVARRVYYRRTLDELRTRSGEAGEGPYRRSVRYFEARLEQLERAVAAARPRT